MEVGLDPSRYYLLYIMDFHPGFQIMKAVNMQKAHIKATPSNYLPKSGGIHQDKNLTNKIKNEKGIFEAKIYTRNLHSS